MSTARAASLLSLALFALLLPEAASSPEVVPVIEAISGPVRLRCPAPPDAGEPACAATASDLGTVDLKTEEQGSDGANLWFPPRYGDDRPKPRVWKGLPTAPAKVAPNRLLKF